MRSLIADYWDTFRAYIGGYPIPPSRSYCPAAAHSTTANLRNLLENIVKNVEGYDLHEIFQSMRNFD